MNHESLVQGQTLRFGILILELYGPATPKPQDGCDWMSFREREGPSPAVAMVTFTHAGRNTPVPVDGSSR